MKNQATCWPTHEQELLLQASLLQGEKALQAWAQWHAIADMDNLNPGEFRLLPLLYRNLSAQGVDDPIMSKLKGIYRQAWYRNRMLFHKLVAILGAFQDAGIQTILLKGAALTVLHYQDYGVRPMLDIDLLVTPEQVLAAVNLLAELGWQPKLSPVRGFANVSLSVKNSHSFRDAGKHELDLHWHVLFECPYPGADTEFWDGAVAVQVDGVDTRALNPTDLLLNVCVHGAVGNRVSPIRWAADVMAILRTSEAEVDWDRLAAHAEKRRLSLPLRDTLGYVKRSLDARVPASTLALLRDTPTSWFERYVYKATIGPPRRYRILLRAWMQHVRYERGTGDGTLQPRVLKIPKYLQQRWGLEHLRQVPVHAGRIAGRRIRKKTTAKSRV